MKTERLDHEQHEDNPIEEYLYSIAASLKRLADLAERIEKKANAAEDDPPLYPPA